MGEEGIQIQNTELDQVLRAPGEQLGGRYLAKRREGRHELAVILCTVSNAHGSIEVGVVNLAKIRA